MRNAVGREIPDFLLENGKEVYQGKNYMDGKYVQKASPKTRRYEKPQESKIVETIKDALIQCGAKDGMTFSFHHHLHEVLTSFVLTAENVEVIGLAFVYDFQQIVCAVVFHRVATAGQHRLQE